MSSTHLQFVLHIFNRLFFRSNLLAEVLHGLVVRLGDGTLMVTQNSDGTVGAVIGEKLFRHRHVLFG